MSRSLPSYLALVVLSAAAASPALAQSKSQQKMFEPFLTRSETTFGIGAGFRSNNLTYDIASDSAGTATPNTFLEDDYRDISILELKGKIRHMEAADLSFIKGDAMIEGDITGGVVIGGHNRLSSYAGDNQTLENYRMNVKNLKGTSIGASATVGYRINLTGTPGRNARNLLESRVPENRRARYYKSAALQYELENAGPYISLMPLVGYGIDQQSYEMKKGYKVLPTQEPFPLKTEYVSNWYGPFFGLEGEIKTRKQMLRLRGEYHDLSYSGKFNDDGDQGVAAFSGDPSWEHEADGNGLMLNAEYAYALDDDYALTLDTTYRKRETDSGTTTLHYSNGVVDDVRLNKVEDESYAMRIGARYNWN